MGDIDELDVELEVLGRLETIVKVPSDQVRVATLRAARAMMQGDFDRGIELAQRAHAIGKVAEPANADQVLQAQMIAPLRERRQLGARRPARRGTGRAVRRCPGLALRSGIRVLRSRPGRNGLGTSSNRWQQIEFASVPRDLAWMQAMAYLAEVAAAVGDARHATALYELMAPYDGRNVGLWDIASGGAVAHFLGILARARGTRNGDHGTSATLSTSTSAPARSQQRCGRACGLPRCCSTWASQDGAAHVWLGDVRSVARGRGFRALDEAADPDRPGVVPPAPLPGGHGRLTLPGRNHLENDCNLSKAITSAPASQPMGVASTRSGCGSEALRNPVEPASEACRNCELPGDRQLLEGRTNSRPRSRVLSASRMALTARLAASSADSIDAKSVQVRT